MALKESLLIYPKKIDLSIQLIGGASNKENIYNKYYIHLTKEYVIIKNYGEIAKEYFE